MKIKYYFVVFIKMIASVIGAATIGMCLLWLVYLLPTNHMAKNIVTSEETLRLQDDSRFLLNEEYWKAYDLGTNIIMLHEVILPSSGNAFVDSLLVPTADYISKWSHNWTDVLIEYATEQEYGEKDYVTYARYWHGYLVFLKPLFMIMDLQGIYVLNGIVLLVLTVYISYLLNKRIGKYWIAYVVAVLTMHPINIIQSFQLSTVFYAMQITMLLLLIKENWEKESILYIFVIDGILVAFLDFLTYPFVAFGIPLMTSLILCRNTTYKDNLIDIISRGVSFAIGYAGMWGMKWILASIFTDENVIADAIESVLHRAGISDSSSDDRFMSIGIPDALQRNVLSYFNEWTGIVLLVTIVIAIIYIIKSKRKVVLDMKMCFVCVVMMISPFMWIAVLNNHASLHPHLEWRTFAVFIYALTVLLINSFSLDRKVGEHNGEKDTVCICR